MARPHTSGIATALYHSRRESGQAPPGHRARFDPDAVSPKGAQGIAQFMPYTAVERGLIDPFDPDSALGESARFLRDLFDEFGNLGLAAAAYNAGPQRVRNWLAVRSALPFETEDYVLAITGRAAEWAEADGEDKPPELLMKAVTPFQKACSEVASVIGTRTPASLCLKGRPPAAAGAKPRAPAPAKARPRPWSVQLAGAFSKDNNSPTLRRPAWASERHRSLQNGVGIRPWPPMGGYERTSALC